MAWFDQNADALGGLQSLFGALGTVFAVVLFGFAVFQYTKAERWKRVEFVSKLYRQLADDQHCRIAMWLMDHSRRDAKFPLAIGAKKLAVDRAYVQRALGADKDLAEITEEIVTIRDAFDRYFRFIEQFELGIQNRLIKAADVRPYFGYWIRFFGGEISPELLKSIHDYIDRDTDFRLVRPFFSRWQVASAKA